MAAREAASGRVVRVAGTILVLIAAGFVLGKLWANRAWFAGWRPTGYLVAVTLAGSVAYAVGSALLPLAWRRLLAWFGQDDAAMGDCYAVYARSQIAKYIPGNVFHFAGRHVMGRQAGLDHGPLAGAALYEIIGLVVASGAIALSGVGFYGAEMAEVPAGSIAAIFIAMLAMPFVLSGVAPKIPMLGKWNLPRKGMSETARGLLPAYGLYLLFFFTVGAVFFWLVTAVSASPAGTAPLAGIAMTAFAASWIAGFITPGSPAGAGVREAMIVLIMGGVIGEAASLLAALNFRVITLFGDILFFLSSYLFGRRVHGAASPGYGGRVNSGRHGVD